MYVEGLFLASLSPLSYVISQIVSFLPYLPPPTGFCLFDLTNSMVQFSSNLSGRERERKRKQARLRRNDHIMEQLRQCSNQNRPKASLSLSFSLSPYGKGGNGAGRQGVKTRAQTDWNAQIVFVFPSFWSGETARREKEEREMVTSTRESLVSHGERCCKLCTPRAGGYRSWVGERREREKRERVTDWKKGEREKWRGEIGCNWAITVVSFRTLDWTKRSQKLNSLRRTFIRFSHRPSINSQTAFSSDRAAIKKCVLISGRPNVIKFGEGERESRKNTFSCYCYKSSTSCDIAARILYIHGFSQIVLWDEILSSFHWTIKSIIHTYGTWFLTYSILLSNI